MAENRGGFGTTVEEKDGKIIIKHDPRTPRYHRVKKAQAKYAAKQARQAQRDTQTKTSKQPVQTLSTKQEPKPQVQTTTPVQRSTPTYSNIGGFGYDPVKSAISKDPQAVIKKAEVRGNQVITTTYSTETKQIQQADTRPVITGGLAERAIKQKAREEKIGKAYQKFYEKTKLAEKPTEGFVGGTVETVKAVGRGVTALPATAFIVGGRAMFLGGVALRGSPEAKREIIGAAKETPKAVVQSYDPRTPTGRASIILTAVAVRTTAKSIQTARAKPITAEKMTTARFEGKQQTLDRTAILAQSKAAGKTVSVKGQAYQVMKAKPQVNIVKGRGQFQTSTGKTINVAQKGFGRKGDFVVLTKVTAKGGKTKTFVDTFRTRQVAKGEFKTVGVSAQISKGQTIATTKPSVGTVSRTSEIASRTLYTESGASLGKTSILQTGRIGAPIKQPAFGKSIQQQIQAGALPKTQQSFLYTPSGRAQTVFETPAGSIAMQSAARSILKAEQTAVLQSQFQTGVSGSAAAVGSVQIAMQKQTTKQTQIPKTVVKAEVIKQPKRTFVQSAGSIQTAKPSQRLLPAVKSTSKTRTESVPRQKPSTKQQPIAKQTPKLTQQLQTQQKAKQTPFPSPGAPTSFAPPKLFARGFGLKLPRFTQVRTEKGVGAPVSQQKKYTPTLTAKALKLFGKPTKAGISTGLGLRPLEKKKKNRGFI